MELWLRKNLSQQVIDIERTQLGNLRINIMNAVEVAEADLGVNGSSSSALSGTLYFKIVQLSETTFATYL